MNEGFHCYECGRIIYHHLPSKNRSWKKYTKQLQVLKKIDIKSPVSIHSKKDIYKPLKNDKSEEEWEDKFVYNLYSILAKRFGVMGTPNNLAVGDILALVESGMEKIVNKAKEDQARLDHNQTSILLELKLKDAKKQAREEMAREIIKMKYDWEKPIDEMPLQWLQHNKTIDEVCTYLKNKGGELNV